MTIDNFSTLLDTLQSQEFVIKPVKIAGDDCVLIYGPHAHFTEDTTKFRSSIWTKDGVLISAGLKKFWNWQEVIPFSPPPTSVMGTVAMEKIDGSCLLISKYKGQLIIRTRGSETIGDYDNGSVEEIDILKKKYPKVFDNGYLEDNTIVCEWVSKAHTIVLKYPDAPNLYLLGMISHKDYSYSWQSSVDELANELEVPRPKLYQFTSLEQMLHDIPRWENLEGCCLYYNTDQSIVKIKSLDYLKKHAFKSEINLEKVVNKFFEYNKPEYLAFYQKIEDDFDYEIAEYAKPYILDCCERYKKAIETYEAMKHRVILLDTLPRKEAAGIILTEYPAHSGIAFDILNKKTLSEKQIIKLMGIS